MQVKEETSMKLRTVTKKNGDWWTGWLVDLPGVNAQDRTKEQLMESLKIGAEDMLNSPFDPKPEEQLVSIEV